MDIVLIVLAILLLLIGLAGCLVPILPGPPLSYLALILLHLTENHHFTGKFLVTWAIIAIAVTVIDNLTPIWGTRKFGGSKHGAWGATIGLLLGLVFFPPLGIIIGPFAGAVVGELIRNENLDKAIKSGFGSLLGFLIGTGMKLVVSGFIIYYFFKELVS